MSTAETTDVGRDIWIRRMLPAWISGSPRRLVLSGAVASALLIALAVWSIDSSTIDAARRARMQELAAFEPPAPSPEAMRASADDGNYARGLEAYAARRWPEAIAALERVDRPDARFYLAIAHLQHGDGLTADVLLGMVEGSGAAFYSREALFYRIKAALTREEPKLARALALDAVKMGAGPAGEAARMRDALEVMRP